MTENGTLNKVAKVMGRFASGPTWLQRRPGARFAEADLSLLSYWTQEQSGGAFMISAKPNITIDEELELVAAVALGVIHRGIGFPGQGFKILPIFGVDGNTYAGGQR